MTCLLNTCFLVYLLNTIIEPHVDSSIDIYTMHTHAKMKNMGISTRSYHSCRLYFIYRIHQCHQKKQPSQPNQIHEKLPKGNNPNLKCTQITSCWFQAIYQTYSSNSMIYPRQGGNISENIKIFETKITPETNSFDRQFCFREGITPWNNTMEPENGGTPGRGNAELEKSIHFLFWNSGYTLEN